MHFKTIAIIGRYQDSGLDAPLRELALVFFRRAGRYWLKLIRRATPASPNSW